MVPGHFQGPRHRGRPGQQGCGLGPRVDGSPWHSPRAGHGWLREFRLASRGRPRLMRAFASKEVQVEVVVEACPGLSPEPPGPHSHSSSTCNHWIRWMCMVRFPGSASTASRRSGIGEVPSRQFRSSPRATNRGANRGSVPKPFRISAASSCRSTAQRFRASEVVPHPVVAIPGGPLQTGSGLSTEGEGEGRLVRLASRTWVESWTSQPKPQTSDVPGPIPSSGAHLEKAQSGFALPARRCSTRSTSSSNVWSGNSPPRVSRKAWTPTTLPPKNASAASEVVKGIDGQQARREPPSASSSVLVPSPDDRQSPPPRDAMPVEVDGKPGVAGSLGPAFFFQS